MATKRVFKIKKSVEEITVVPELVSESLPKRVIKVKKADQPVQKEKVAIKIKKTLPVPIPPLNGISLTAASEAFEALRAYYAERDEPIPNEDLVWYQAELEAEKKEYEGFWERCCVTKAIMEAIFRGDDEIGIMKAEMAAKALEKKQPIRKEDIGAMPSYGTPEFWAWCRKRKLLKEQEDAAIIAAGGTVKPVKPKKKKVAEV